MLISSQDISEASQRGAVLLLVMFILGLAAATYALSSAQGLSIQAHQEKKADQILLNAKEALIGYTLGRTANGERPGNMPRPDYFATTESPPNYDGQADSGCLDATKANGLPLKSSGANMRCLGRLPWRDIAMLTATRTQHDPVGEMPWYAVSANLVDPVCMSVINPGILQLTYQGYICEGTTLPHPWLTVRDSRGNILSNRVAFILILPGKPLSNQARPESALADVSHYLDTWVVPGNCIQPCVPGTYSNADMDNDFIQPLASQQGIVNDRLVFVTIDQLLPILEKRAAQEVRGAIDFPKIYSAYGFKYRPWMVPFNNPGEWPSHFSWSHSHFVEKGLIPFRVCSESSGIVCIHSPWVVVEYPKVIVSGSLSSQQLESYLNYFIDHPEKCTPKVININNSANPNLECEDSLLNDLPGNVLERVVQLKVIGMKKEIGYEEAAYNKHAKQLLLTKNGPYDVLKVTDYKELGCHKEACVVGRGTISTDVSAQEISVRVFQYLYPVFPEWYFENKWYQYIYAALAPAYKPGATMNCVEGCLTVMQPTGGKVENLPVVVMAAGVALNQTLLKSSPTFSATNPAQLRNSTNLSDYFDSVNNVSSGLVFDHAWSATSLFNDQVIW